MKGKILFILVVLVYGFLGFVARLTTPFIELTSLENITNSFLGYLILVSVLISAIFFIWFKRVFPKGYEKQTSLGLIAIFIAFSCVSFAVNRGWLFNLNTWSPRFVNSAQFVVKDKYFEKTRRSKFYRLNLQELKSQNELTFIVKERTYSESKLNDTLNLKVFEGFFKIWYCKYL